MSTSTRSIFGPGQTFTNVKKVVPISDLASDLGTPTKRFKTAYVQALNATTATVDSISANNLSVNGNPVQNFDQTLNTTDDVNFNKVTATNGLSTTGLVGVDNTTNSFDTTSGALVVAGGVGINEALNVGGALNAQAVNAPNIAQTDPAGGVSVSGTADSTSTITGAVVIDGGVGIAKALRTGGRITAEGSITTANQVKFGETANCALQRVGDNRVALVNSSGVGSNVPTIAVFNGSGSRGDGTVSQITVAKNGGGNNGVNLTWKEDALVPANNHGCLVVTGASSGCAVELYETGKVIIDGSELETNTVLVKDTTASTSSTTGALQVAGGGGIAQDLHVGSNVYINGSPVSTGAYSTIVSTTVDFNTLGNTLTSLVAAPPNGVGNPIIIPNKIRTGGHYCLKASGKITCAQNSDIAFVIILGNPFAQPTPTTWVAQTLNIAGLGPCSNKPWQIDGYITARSVGVAGQGGASLVGRLEFRTNVDQQNNFFGDSVTTFNNTDFDTTDLNIFDLQAQWVTSQANNSITCEQFVGSTTFQP